MTRTLRQLRWSDGLVRLSWSPNRATAPAVAMAGGAPNSWLQSGAGCA